MLQFLRVILIIFCLIGGLQYSRAQYVPIPDTGFRHILFYEGYGGCFIDSLMDTTCPMVVNATELSLNSNVDTLEGVQYFDNLQRLCSCNGATLRYIPIFNKTLKEIIFSHPFLGDTLPPLPDSLQVFQLIATDSQLYIPDLPATITELYLITPGNNNFPVSFPQHLQRLDLGWLPLYSIPALPSTLKQMLLFRPQFLNELPTLPDSLYSLHITETQIGTLPRLPASLKYLDLINNQLLSCLPLLPDSLVRLDLTGTPVTCLPNIPANPDFEYSSDIDSLQLCNGANGLVCDSSLLCDTTDVMAIAVVKLTPLFPGDTTEIYIAAGNSCANGLSGKVHVIIDGPVTYIQPLPFAFTPDVEGDTLTYIIPDFGNLPVFTAIQFTVRTDTVGIAARDSVRFRVIVVPDGGDSNHDNNSTSQWMDIQNSYDPNIKEVSPLSTLPLQDEPHELKYTIHFQNTGTAAARNIIIRDTLDPLLDTATFKVLGFSHGLQTFREGNALRFVFPNINLPDSTANEKESHGYLQYSVKTMRMLGIGSTIRNSASIYFDFNPPIVTNTTENTVLDLNTSITTIVNPHELNIYPNPANDYITLQWQGKETTAIVYNMLGTKEMELVVKAGKTVTNVKHLPAGIYYVVLNNNSNRATQRFVKH